MVSLVKSDHRPFSKVASWHLHCLVSSNLTIHTNHTRLLHSLYLPHSVTIQCHVITMHLSVFHSDSHEWTVQSHLQCKFPCLESIYGLVWIGQDKFPHSIQIIFIVTAWRNNVTSHLYFLAAGNNCSWIVMVGQDFLVEMVLVYWCVLKHWWEQLQLKWLVMVCCGFRVVLSK